MASVIAEPRTTPFFRGHLTPSKKSASLLSKKSKTSELVLEKIFDKIIEAGSIKISCLLTPTKKKKEQFFNSHQEFTFIDTKNNNKEVKAYFKIPPATQTNTTKIDANTILASVANKNNIIIVGAYQTPAPPAQRFCASKLNTKCNDIEGIPVKELDKIYNALTIIGLANPSPHQIQEYTLTYGNRKFTAFVDTTPNGLDPFICFDNIGSGKSKHVSRGLNLRTKKIRAYSFADIEIGTPLYNSTHVSLDTKNFEVALREQVTIQNLSEVVLREQVSIQNLSRGISPVNPCPNIVRYFGITNARVNQLVTRKNHLGKEMERLELRATQIAEMQLADQGDLFHLIQEKGVIFKPCQLIDIIGQILNGVAILHKYDMIHKDLKLENIFLGVTKDEKLRIKIGDFGFMGLNDTCGSPAYTAPEIYNYVIKANLIECDPEKPLYTTACDIYSLSVIVFAMIVLSFPSLAYKMQALTNKKVSEERRNHTIYNLLSDYLKSPSNLDFGYISLPVHLNTFYLKMSGASPLKRESVEPLSKYLSDHKKEMENEIILMRSELRELNELENTFIALQIESQELQMHSPSSDKECEHTKKLMKIRLHELQKKNPPAYKKEIERQILQIRIELEEMRTKRSLVQTRTAQI